MGSKSVLIILLSLAVLVGCNRQISVITAIEGTQTLPETYENPNDLPGPMIDEPAEIEQPPIPEKVADKAPDKTTAPLVPKPKPKPKILPKTLPSIPIPLKPPTLQLTKKPITRPALPPASKFIINAEWVMINEGKKIGTPCNFYLGRVLVVSGYSSDRFLANDFDIYAKKNLKSATLVHFVNDGKGSEQARLKQHLWSFPERTPFIMQWSRTGVVGHVAIVERIGKMLIIYQASLNKYSARKDYTTISRLLSGDMRRTLTVYSGF